MKIKLIVAGLVLGVGAATLVHTLAPLKGKTTAATTGAPPSQAPTASAGATAAADDLQPQLYAQLATYRKLIVLYADDKAGKADQELARQAGQLLFHASLDQGKALQERVALLVQQSQFAALGQMLDYIETAPALYDADRLAFKELLVGLQVSLQGAQTLTAVKLHKRVTEDLESLADIEALYEKELAKVFGRFDVRGIELKRERWDDYVSALKKRYDRAAIIKETGVTADTTPASPPEAAAGAPAPGATRGETELFGKSLPPKTIVLTFDDGPHAKYTMEIAAILRQYGVPGVFFQVGNNLGSLDAAGKPHLGANAAIDTKLLAGGYALANHSFSHAQLSKLHGAALRHEMEDTDRLLKEISPKRSVLFRFPYGARNNEGKALVTALGLTSVMWNVDSLDWSDPLPTSIADRVLRQVDQEKKGIVLFHDIHGKTVKALPLVLERLLAQGYRFAGWNGQEFSVSPESTAAAAALSTAATDKAQATAGAANWAVVIGINDYQKWPKLQYAARDAKTMQETLVDKLGFQADHVLALTDKDATRANILSLFNNKLSATKVGKNDRVFVFYAGHGSTEQLSSGRNLGYIIPVDADPAQTATDAIAMTELQNIAEGLAAKHVFFVMDACYSGLGLTRGGGDRFARDNDRRIGRQMLTAGGADQLVADGGPGGHSVFTWTLLQALNGKADLNGDGIITATEIAAYVAPAVAKISSQTPAFGSLPGSEGGEFVFETPKQNEFLTEQTTQLAADAIALNLRMQKDKGATSPPGGAPATVVVPNLQGQAQVVSTGAAAPSTPRQQAEAANNRGLLLYKEKQYALAQAAFEEALKLRRDYALAANNLGFTFFKEGKHREAIQWFETTLKLDPSRAVAYLNIADAWQALGEKDKAKKAYATYLELAPKGPSAEHARQQLAL